MPNLSLSTSFKSEIKKTISLGIPLIVSQLIYASSYFVGTAMVAHISEDALAASVLVSMTWMTISTLFFGILNAVSVLVAHQFGAKNYQAISDIMGQAFKLGLIISIIMLIVLPTMSFFLQFTTQPPIVLTLSKEYLFALLWTIPGLIALIILEQFLIGINRAKFVLRISLLVVPIEIPIIYILIFGKFGLPKLGIAGIGYGFAITYTTTACVLTLILAKAKTFEKFAVFKHLRKFNFYWLKEFFNVGLPMGCMHVIEVTTFLFATFWIARFGTTMLAAHQILMQFLGFASTLIFAMSQAVTIRVGHAVGEQDLYGIKLAIYVGMLLSFLCVIIIAAGFIMFPSFFLRFDINIHAIKNASLLQDASILLGIAGILMLFDNFRIIGFGALRGLKDTQFCMYSSLIAFWIIGLSIAFFFGFILDWQGPGIWWGLTVGIAAGALMVCLRLQWLLKRINLTTLAKLVD